MHFGQLSCFMRKFSLARSGSVVTEMEEKNLTEVTVIKLKALYYNPNKRFCFLHLIYVNPY